MSKSARFNTLLEENNLEVTLGFITFILSAVVSVIVSGILLNVFKMDTNLIVMITGAISGFIVYKSVYSTGNGTINVINKKTKKIAYTRKNSFVVVPPFSGYRVEKVNDFDVMTISAASGYQHCNPKGNAMQFAFEIYGDFVVVDSGLFLKEGGRSSFTQKALNELKKQIKDAISSENSLDDKEIERLSHLAKKKIQDKFGILFHEFATFRAVLN